MWGFNNVSDMGRIVGDKSVEDVVVFYILVCANVVSKNRWHIKVSKTRKVLLRGE